MVIGGLPILAIGVLLLVMNALMLIVGALVLKITGDGCGFSGVLMTPTGEHKCQRRLW